MKIAIASEKGETGKTTISTNLADFITETQKVELVDASSRDFMWVKLLSSNV